MDRCPFCKIDGATPIKYNIDDWALDIHTNINGEYFRKHENNMCNNHKQELKGKLNKLEKVSPSTKVK